MSRVSQLVVLGVLGAALTSHAQVGAGLRNQAQFDAGAGGRSQSQRGIPPLLLHAIRVQPRLRYTGEYTTEFRQGAKTNRHQEFITRDRDKYRIDFPEDSQFAGQVIVENNSVRLHYRPNTNEIMQQPPRHGEAWEKVANLANTNRFVLSAQPGEVVAGLRTRELVVSDKAGNVNQRLFIEPVSGVILKRQVFDLVGTQIGYFEFNQIDLNPKIDPSIFTIKRNAPVITPAVQLQRISKRRKFNYRYLPPSSGFQLETTAYKNFAGVDGLVETYLNRRVRLWIYVLKAPVDIDRLRNKAAKNQHAFSFENEGETVVLFGAIDEPTLSRFASMMMNGTAPARG